MLEPLKILSVVGARPNFMKIAPFAHAIERHNANPTSTRSIAHTLLHSGQHYDDAMSTNFFRSLNIPEPDVNLDIGSGTHAEQVGKTMIAFEAYVTRHPPDWIVVVGDVNATCACALTAAKQWIKLAHIEAGLRSFDMTMPEEVNRIVTDRLSNLLLTPDGIADDNLRAEGMPEASICCVGNIMIDTLVANRSQAEGLESSNILQGKRLAENRGEFSVNTLQDFALMTLHRPSNVDSPDALSRLVRCFIDDVATTLPLLWTIHPRARSGVEEFDLWKDVCACPRIHLMAPLDYHEMLKLNMHASVMLSDSGGLQEECSALGTPCLTLRENTERPGTLIEHGGLCVLVGNDPERIRIAFKKMHAEPRRACHLPHSDGHTAERVVEAIIAADCTDSV